MGSPILKINYWVIEIGIGEAACSVLKNYDTENIKEFAQEILEKVVRERTVKPIVKATDFKVEFGLSTTVTGKTERDISEPI